jgi:hypothetical protein
MTSNFTPEEKRAQFRITDEQHEMLMIALNSNAESQFGAVENRTTAAADLSGVDLYSDKFDMDFSLIGGGGGGGEGDDSLLAIDESLFMPNPADDTGTHEKRNHPDEDDDDDDDDGEADTNADGNGLRKSAKRQDSSKKSFKKPGRKPLTKEPVSVCVVRHFLSHTHARHDTLTTTAIETPGAKQGRPEGLSGAQGATSPEPQ